MKRILAMAMGIAMVTSSFDIGTPLSEYIVLVQRYAKVSVFHVKYPTKNSTLETVTRGSFHDDLACLNAGEAQWVAADGTDALNKLHEKNHGPIPLLCPEMPDQSPTPDHVALKLVSKCLDDFSIEKFLETIRGKTVSMIGDSIVGQQFENLLCLLPEESVVNIDRPASLLASPVEEREHRGFHRVDLKDNTSIQFLMADGNTTMERGWATVLSEVPALMEADVLLFNIGSWFRLWSDLEESMRDFAQYVKTIRFTGRVFFREYSPPHFPYSQKAGTDFDDAMSYVPANVAIPDATGPSWNQRVQADGNKAYICEQGEGLREMEFKRSSANTLAESLGFTVLPIYDLSKDGWNMHSGVAKSGKVTHVQSAMNTNVPDCRHWAQPSPIIDVWHRVFYKYLVNRV